MSLTRLFFKLPVPVRVYVFQVLEWFPIVVGIPMRIIRNEMDMIRWAATKDDGYGKVTGKTSWRVFFCRLAGHPAGQVYYSHGTEPDTHCNFCEDYIW